MVCAMCTISRLSSIGAGVVVGSMGVMHRALQRILGEDSIGQRQDSYSLHCVNEPAGESPHQQLAYALRQIMLKCAAFEAELYSLVRLSAATTVLKILPTMLWYTILIKLK